MTAGTVLADNSFFQSLREASDAGPSFHWVMLGSVLAALVLGAFVPEARPRLRAAVLLIVASALGTLIWGVLVYRGIDRPSGYRWIHFAAQLFLAIGLINLAGVLLFRVLLAPIRLQPPPILRDTILGLSYVAATIALLGSYQVNLSGIIATSAVLTAVIGFSLQDTLGNIMGGVALQMERSVAVGDWVRVGDVEGVVREIRWRQTSIETRNWDTVVIPNSVLVKSQVTVWGRRQGKPRLHRMAVPFNVDFRHSPAEVVDAVERALRAEGIPNVSPDPPPDCIVTEFKDSYATYAVRYWLIDFARDAPTSSEVRTRVFVALQRAGMALSIPAQSVFMTLEGRSRAQRKQQEELDRRVAALHGVMILEPLDEHERLELAERLTVAPFRRGEAVTRQGNEAHYLYIIIRGEVEVRVAVENGHSRQVATLRAGDVLGEMGLMTGEPRSATAIALTDVVCYRLDKDVFKDVLHRRPEIAESISHLLAKRKVELDATTHDLSAEAVRQRMNHTQGDMLHRIRKFFTLT